MLRTINIGKSFHGLNILSDVSFSISPGEKIALVGYNGSGKSTLLKILAGIVPPDSGTVELIDQPSIGYLPQEISMLSSSSIAEYLKNITGIEILEKIIHGLENNRGDDKPSEEYRETIQKYSAVDGYAFQHRAQVILRGFGLQIDLSRSINSLSGGQKTKVMITGLLLSKPDILLLDEPTNNLDLPSVIWLEQYLFRSRSAALIVSHDRKFLDQITVKTIELDWFTRHLNKFPGTYSDYLIFRLTKSEQEKAAALRQQREQKRMTASIREKKLWAAQGKKQITTDHDKYIRGRRRDRAAKADKTAKAMAKQLERMDEIIVSSERVRLVIPLIAHPSDAKHSILLENVEFSYPPGFSLGPINCHIRYGSRVGIIGLNGTGKTTLLRIITGVIKPRSGQVTVGNSLQIGNLTQAHENLPSEKTVIDYLTIDQGINKDLIYLLLTKFNFNVQDATKTIGVLSPGERARLLFLIFSERKINTLVLDEPTNHLDLEALEALESALKEYTGTIIFVSHDRDFLEKIMPDTLYLLENGQTRMISDYHQYLNTAKITAERLMRLL